MPKRGVPHFVECAFNYNDQAQAFIFTVDQCVQINYDTPDSVIKGPMSIGHFFPSLKYSIFATGIDAAFTSSVENEVYIFRSNIYALLDFKSGKIIKGPDEITHGFPYLKNTIFEDGIDAAFASSKKNEAYIFKGNQYALINYINPRIPPVFPQNIILGFPSLKGTVFDGGLDAAFLAREANQAYIFKGNTYALIDYAAPGTPTARIVTPITSGLNSLKGFIPRYT